MNMSKSEVIVHQVRAIDPFGNERTVHSYETVEQAQQAIQIMKGKTRLRYVIVPVPNRPDEHWGINFPV